MEVRCVGIDLGKKTMETRFLDSQGKVEAWNGRTDALGREKLIKKLTVNDKVCMEACALAFVLAREIQKKGSKVYVLNPGKLHFIFRSVKKTDAEDAMKLARFLQTVREEELPTVPIPELKEEADRALVSDCGFWTAQRTRLINRLHSIFVRAGETGVTKAMLKDEASRENALKLLADQRLSEAKRICFHLTNLELDLEELEAEQKKSLTDNPLTPLLLSVPGVGIQTAMAFAAHVGTGERFYSATQVSNFAGMVPRLDISGQMIHYGHIHKRGCVALRRLLVQSAWALVRSKGGGDLKRKYTDLSKRRGKKIAIVAIGKKILELLWTLARKQEYYRFVEEADRVKKLKFYGFENVWGSVA
jgi:transposase